MWRCKECGGEMFSIEKEIKKNKYRLDKDKNEIQLIGYVKKIQIIFMNVKIVQM